MTCSACVHGDMLADGNAKPLEQMEMADRESLKHIITVRQRNIHWLPFVRALIGTKPAT